ncbi:hypothetical protein [Arthrobacter sp. KBS0703]|uniref:hypothetical protein n=1 Tax=Arthrobacter sp. KBS0703 TaxID=1955698 RepID=UPI0011169398|nr:hypothetical protein [Arthrobacter sp. KBS0703]
MKAKRESGKKQQAPARKSAARKAKATKGERGARREPHDPKVNGLNAKRPSPVAQLSGAEKRVEFGRLEARYKAIAYARKPDTELAERQWRSAATALLADLHEYQHEVRGLLSASFYDKVLEDFRRWRTGLKAISLGAISGSVSYAPVPSELSSRKGGPVVSGGLPTLGRRREACPPRVAPMWGCF